MTLYCIHCDDGWYDLHPRIFASAEARDAAAEAKARREAAQSIRRTYETELRLLRKEYYQLDVDETGEYTKETPDP